MKRVDMLDSKSNAERRESSNLSSRTNQKIIMKICCVDVCNKECVKHRRYCHEHYLKRKSELYFKRKWVFKRSIAHLWRSKTQSRYSKPLSPNTETRPSRWLPSIDLWLGSIVRAFSMVPFRNYGIICVSGEETFPSHEKEFENGWVCSCRNLRRAFLPR